MQSLLHVQTTKQEQAVLSSIGFADKWKNVISTMAVLSDQGVIGYLADDVIVDMSRATLDYYGSKLFGRYNYLLARHYGGDNEKLEADLKSLERMLEQEGDQASVHPVLDQLGIRGNRARVIARLAEWDRQDIPTFLRKNIVINLKGRLDNPELVGQAVCAKLKGLSQ